MESNKKYYLSTFFWSVFQKCVGAVFSFISVPLLLEFYGKSSYGLLAVATSCNAYMHLLDLGMNNGATRFFSRWRAEGKENMINRVAQTNITFYMIIAVINIIFLLGLSWFGERLFSVSHTEFLQLRECFLVLALFSFFSWGTTTFNQLLIADGQLAYTLQLQCVVAILKCVLVISVLVLKLPLTVYFFLLSGIVASLVIPYMLRCKRHKLIGSIKPARYWKDFKVVMTFSLALFGLSVFQITAKDSRSIILSMLAADGAGSVAEYSIISAIPQLIIMVGGTFTGMFLPKTSAMVVSNNQNEISDFAYKWTLRTTVIMCIISFPFMICSRELLSAYVGIKYSYLAPWLFIWCLTVLIQNHTAPLGSLVYGYGKTKVLIMVTAISCVLSIIVNASLCKLLGVGSAIIGYAIYVFIIIGLYYVYFNKYLLHLQRFKVCLCFLKPTVLAAILAFIVYYLPINYSFLPVSNQRVYYLLICIIKSVIWLLPYIALLQLSKVIDFRFLLKK